MEELKEFLVLRYSLVEEPQNAFGVEAIPIPKGAAILSAIVQDREFQLNGVRYGFVGFTETLATASHVFPPSRFFMGKVAKLKQAHMGKKIPGDIIETQEDDWLPVLTVFDVVGQYIFVRKDYRFGTPEQTMRAIQAGLREMVMAQYNHRVFVEGCTRKEHFWRVVSDHRKFYKLELKLISPNILETNRRARDSLAALKSLFGQDQVSIILNNESGELLVPKQPVANYLEYIEEGEGSWALTTEGVHGGKKTYSSADNVDTVDIFVPDERPPEHASQLDLENVSSLPSISSSEAVIVAQVRAEVDRYRER